MPTHGCQTSLRLDRGLVLWEACNVELDLPMISHGYYWLLANNSYY